MRFYYSTAVSRCKPPLCYFLHKFSQGFLASKRFRLPPAASRPLLAQHAFVRPVLAVSHRREAKERVVLRKNRVINRRVQPHICFPLYPGILLRFTKKHASHTMTAGLGNKVMKVPCRGVAVPTRIILFQHGGTNDFIRLRILQGKQFSPLPAFLIVRLRIDPIIICCVPLPDALLIHPLHPLKNQLKHLRNLFLSYFPESIPAHRLSSFRSALLANMPPAYQSLIVSAAYGTCYFFPSHPSHFVV